MWTSQETSRSVLLWNNLKESWIDFWGRRIKFHTERLLRIYSATFRSVWLFFPSLNLSNKCTFASEDFQWCQIQQHNSVVYYWSSHILALRLFSATKREAAGTLHKGNKRCNSAHKRYFFPKSQSASSHPLSEDVLQCLCGWEQEKPRFVCVYRLSRNIWPAMVGTCGVSSLFACLWSEIVCMTNVFLWR